VDDQNSLMFHMQISSFSQMEKRNEVGLCQSHVYAIKSVKKVKMGDISL